MADEVLTGTATPATPVNAMTAPVEQQAPQATEQQPQVPGGGKSAEQLAAELKEASELIHETQERLARMEHDRELERQMRTNLTAERGQAPEAPEIDFDKLDGEYMTSPTRATAKVVQAQIAELRKEQQRERTAQYITSARSAFESARDSALKANPALFKGILEDVSREIIGNVDFGLKSGQPVDVEILRNPKYLEAAAVAYRVMNGEDISKYYGGTRTPMTAGHTETPTAGVPPQAGPALTDKELAMAQFLGGTPEQWAAAKAKGK